MAFRLRVNAHLATTNNVVRIRVPRITSQNVAIGLIGDPVPPTIGIGAIVNRKSQRFNRRLELMKDLEQDFAKAGAKHPVEAHKSLYGGAAQLVLSPRLKAFDCVVVSTAHKAFPFPLILRHARAVVDTRNAYKSRRSAKITRL